jgi:hypothetical protein
MLGELAMRLHIRYRVAHRSSVHSFIRRTRSRTIRIPIDFALGPAASALAAAQEKNLCETDWTIGRFNWQARGSHPVMNACSSVPSVQPARLIRRESMSQPEPDINEVVRSIAEETDTPAETVSRMYADTLADYRHDARVFGYVPLFAAKKVRNQLRHRSNHEH